MKVLNLSFLFTGVLSEAIFHLNSNNDLYVCTRTPISDLDLIDHPHWTKIPMAQVTDISCNKYDDCWAVAEGGILFYLGNIVKGEPLWRYNSRPFMTSKPRSVSVADDGTVWVTTIHNQIFKGKDGEAFKQVGKGLDVAAISYYKALVVGEDGQLYHYSENMFAPPNWDLNPHLGSDRLIKVSRCENNDIWAIRQDGAIWRQVRWNSDARVAKKFKDRIFAGIEPEAYATDIVCKDDRIYHVGRSGEVFINRVYWWTPDYTDLRSNKWHKIPVTTAVSLG